VFFRVLLVSFSLFRSGVVRAPQAYYIKMLLVIQGDIT
jgi:hypothetical protein